MGRRRHAFHQAITCNEISSSLADECGADLPAFMVKFLAPTAPDTVASFVWPANFADFVFQFSCLNSAQRAGCALEQQLPLAAFKIKQRP